MPQQEVAAFAAFEEILSTYNPLDVAMIKSMLETEEIPYYFQGEAFHQVLPPVDPARLMVEKEFADQARDLLQDVIVRYRGLGLNPPS